MKNVIKSIMLLFLLLFSDCASNNNTNNTQQSIQDKEEIESEMTAQEENTNIFNEKYKEVITMRDSLITMEDIIKKQHDTIIDCFDQLEVAQKKLEKAQKESKRKNPEQQVDSEIINNQKQEITNIIGHLYNLRSEFTKTTIDLKALKDSFETAKSYFEDERIISQIISDSLQIQLERVNSASSLLDNIILTTEASGDEIENFLKSYATNNNTHSDEEVRMLHRQLQQARDSIKALQLALEGKTPSSPSIVVVSKNGNDYRDDSIKKLNILLEQEKQNNKRLEEKYNQLHQQLAKHKVSDLTIQPLSSNKKAKNILECEVYLKIDWIACEKTKATLKFRLQKVEGGTRVAGNLIKSTNSDSYPIESDSLSFTHIENFYKNNSDIEHKKTKFTLLTKGLQEGYYDLDVYMDGKIVYFRNFRIHGKDEDFKFDAKDN